MRDVRNIIIRPVVTERSTIDSDERGAYTFIVDKGANKIEIRNAVEKLFGVKVDAVRTMNYRGKVRRLGTNIGKRASYKKAVVKLAEGERIDVYEGV
jgi:large subunit ribosomal protein L23